MTLPADEASRLQELEERLAKQEKENRELAAMYLRLEEQCEALTNVYVVSYRLQGTLDGSEVMRIVKDVLIELVGAEEFAILMFDDEKGQLNLIESEGAEDRIPGGVLPAGEGIVGQVTTSGQSLFFEPETRTDRETALPLAAIPLRMDEGCVGVVVIYKLLTQKQGLTSVDHQLLELLATHAATAFVTAQIYSDMDRKLRTVQSFVQLIKTR